MKIHGRAPRLTVRSSTDFHLVV